MKKIDPRMADYLGEFSAAASSTPSAAAFTPSSVPSLGVQTAEQLRREAADAARVAAEMWTRDAAAEETLTYGGRFVKTRGAFSTTASSGELDVENRAFREGDDKRYLACDWYTVLVNKTCNEDNVARFLLSQDRFYWAQSNVKRLLAEKALIPRITRYNATRWAAWVQDVYKYVSLAYWSMNIRAYDPLVPTDASNWTGARPFGKTWLAWDGPKVQAARDRFLVAQRSALQSVTDDSGRQEGIGAAMPRFFSLADATAVTGAEGIDPFFSALRRTPTVPKSESDFLPTFGGTVTPEFSRFGATSFYIRHPSKAATSSGVYGPQSQEFFNAIGSGYDRFTRWMVETSTFSAGDRPLMVNVGFNDARGRLVWSPRLAADGQIEWATAIAEDLLLSSYGSLQMESMLRWSDSIALMPPYVREGARALTTAVRAAAEANRQIAEQRVRSASASSSATTSVGGSDAAVVQQLSKAIYDFLLGLLSSSAAPVARGASTIPWCPPPPFMRTMSQEGCDMGEMIRRATTTATAATQVRPSGETFVSDQKTATDTSTGGRTGVSPLVTDVSPSSAGSGGGAAAGAVAAGAGVLLYLLFGGL